MFGDDSFKRWLVFGGVSFILFLLIYAFRDRFGSLFSGVLVGSIFLAFFFIVVAPELKGFRRDELKKFKKYDLFEIKDAVMEQHAKRFKLSPRRFSEPNVFVSWLEVITKFPFSNYFKGKEKIFFDGFSWTGQELVYPKKGQWIALCEAYVESGLRRGFWVFIFPMYEPISEVKKGYHSLNQSLVQLLGPSGLYKEARHAPVQEVSKFDSILSNVGSLLDDEDLKEIAKNQLLYQNNLSMPYNQGYNNRVTFKRKRSSRFKRSGYSQNYFPPEGGDVGG